VVFQQLNTRPFGRCPFVDLPNSKSSRWGGGVTVDEMREMQWVGPELVAQIRFVEWTAEGRLRHAAFLGLRSDKSARKVWREATENIRDGMNSTRSGPHAGCASGIGVER
jgi:ATP-dependent DNA ligase